MKAVMISIQPKWVHKILSGEKTVEVRKTAPKIATPFKCYIYCTLSGSNELFRETLNGDVAEWNRGKWADRKGNVVAEFICDKVECFSVPYPAFQNQMNKSILEQSCLTYYQLHRYAYHDKLYGWHISDLKVYDKPKELREFCKTGALPIDELDEELCNYCSHTDYGESRCSFSPDGAIFCEGSWCDIAYEEYLDEFALTRPPQSWCYVEVE